MSSHTSDPIKSPSPHISLQIVFVVGLPPVQDQPVRFPLHVELQPIESLVPSSHVSGEITFPSPQIGLQTELEAPVQAYPVSI